MCKHIAHSQDWLCNLEIGTQFRDSENAQYNLEIAQIPRLRRTYTWRQVLLVYCKCLFCREWCAGYTLPHLPPMLCIHSKQPPVIQDLITSISPHHHQCWVGWVGVTVIETDSRMVSSTYRPGLARTSTSCNPTPPLYKLKSTFHNDNRNTAVHYIIQYSHLYIMHTQWLHTLTHEHHSMHYNIIIIMHSWIRPRTKFQCMGIHSNTQ